MNRINYSKFYKNVVNPMATEAVSIKGTKNGLVIMLDPHADLEEIKNNLRMKMENSQGFFKGAKFSLYSPDTQGNKQYTSEVEVICRQFGLIPSSDISWPAENLVKNQAEPALTSKKPASVIPIRHQANAQGEPVLMIRRTLRSGQKITSPSSIVILGDINPGAEVLSENSIYILGTCNGLVHAGVSGNLLAEVVTLNYQPIVLRIGSITADPALIQETNEPVVAKVIRGKIVLKKY